MAVPVLGLKVAAFRHTVSMHSCSSSSASSLVAPHLIAKALRRPEQHSKRLMNACLSLFLPITTRRLSRSYLPFSSNSAPYFFETKQLLAEDSDLVCKRSVFHFLVKP